MSRKPLRWLRRIAVVSVVFVALVAVGGLVFKHYATPMRRDNINVPVYTVGDANYAAALNEGKNIVKFGRLPFGIYPGGIAFDDPLQARENLKEIGKEADWDVYQLSGDFALDTKPIESRRYTNKSLLVVRRVGRDSISYR